jgi:Magnesium chelatase, subunit ChlI
MIVGVYRLQLTVIRSKALSHDRHCSKVYWDAEDPAGILTPTSLCWGRLGAGKSKLARQLATILPAMTFPEAINITRMHRVASRTGLTGDRTAVVTTRPCRTSHQTVSDVGLIGGGQVPLPGEVSLAHHGMLFLDELPEFRRHVLEVLRQPLENGIAEIQSRERPRVQCFRGHSCAAAHFRRLGPRTVAAFNDGCGDDIRMAPRAPPYRSSQ